MLPDAPNQLSYAPANPVIAERMQLLEELYTSVLRNREALGKATAGLRDDVFKTRSGYFGSTTFEEAVHLLSHLHVPPDGNITVLDFGSGSGRFLLQLVAIRSNIQRLIGIEDDENLHEMSSEILQEAEKSHTKLGEPLVGKGQIEFLKGNFFHSAFKNVVSSSDRAFYYLSSADDEEKIVDLIGKNLTKPNARLLAFGDAKNPFPELVTKHGFARSEAHLLNIYSKDA